MKNNANALSYYAEHKAHCLICNFIEREYPLTTKEVHEMVKQLHRILDSVEYEMLNDSTFIDEQENE